MCAHRLEVYMDTYTSKPIIKETDESLCINIGDEISVESWVRLLTGTNSEIKLKVKVADVRHLFWDGEECRHSISIRVVPVTRAEE